MTAQAHARPIGRMKFRKNSYCLRSFPRREIAVLGLTDGSSVNHNLTIHISRRGNFLIIGPHAFIAGFV